MADIIQLLPESVANQIAAGEVIQRPASVVKELVENSIDADSDWIQLIIKNAGKTSIQVIDNGRGMSDTDARMSFERHATSKIQSAEDIFNISTKGFRGEALASIASIANVELKTKREEDDLGTKITISGSKLSKQEYCETPKGTSFSVKNLFFNIPARRKFLKTDATELAHIIEEFKRIALAHPNIRFNLYHNDEELYHLPSGNLKQRIVGLFGKIYNERIIPVDEETDVVGISGFIGKQEAAKSKRGEQYLFVNNRYIKSPYLNHAIKNAYTDIIPDDQHPFYVVFLKISPDKIDINIHPTKQEIKFEEEKLIYNFLRVTIKHGLGKYLITPALDFDKELSLEQSYRGQQSTQTSNSPSGFTVKSPNWDKVKPKWESLYIESQENATDISQPITLASSLPSAEEEQSWEQNTEIKNPYQIHNSYIINQIKSGYVLINQQNAHERILYEKYLNQLQSGKGEIQNLLFPITIEFKKDEYLTLEKILTKVKVLGFDIEGFGGSSFIVRGIPVGLEQHDAKTLIEKLLDQYEQNLSLDIDINENIAKSMAKTSAIKTGTKMNVEEMTQVINQLFSCESPYKSPSGKKCFITYELEQLEKAF